ncbi:MAG TPA: EAL domain-containing protein [Chloroflexota bacterium]|nr:EAL domain-containing protein [Chloroflexota bacterium]
MRWISAASPRAHDSEAADGPGPANPTHWRELAPYGLAALLATLAFYLHLNQDSNLVLGGTMVAAVILSGLLLCRQGLILLENRRLYHRLDRAYAAQSAHLARRVADLEWLQDVTRRVNAARTLDEALDIAYDGIHDGLGYDRIGIELFDQAAGTFEDCLGTDALGNKFRPQARELQLGPDNPIWQFPGVAAVLGGAESYYTADATADCPPDLLYLFDGSPKDNLVVALRAGQAVVGMISVDNLVTGRPIAASDAGPLLPLAHQVGVAVERARAVETLRASEARLALQYASTRVLTEATTLDGAVNTLLRILCEHLDWHAGAFWEVDAVQGVLRRHTAWCGSSGDIAESDAFSAAGAISLGEGILGQVWMTGTLDWSDDLAQDSRSPQAASALARPYHGALWFPIVAAGRVQGVMELFSRRTQPRDDTLLEAMATLGRQLGGFIERLQAEEALVHQAAHDALTDLPNRTLLRDRLEHCLQAASRDDTPVTLLLLDLDHFKEINDSLGHAAGDRVLAEISARLVEALPEPATVARLGGDEFAILLPECDQNGAMAGAQRVLVALGHPYMLDGQALHIEASIGVACRPDHGTDATTLLRHADVAMYAAKRTQRGAAIYAAAEDAHSAGRLALMTDLRQALGSEGQLELYYQPKAQVASGEPCGVEALIRWHHPTRGMVSPDAFIPLAEQMGVIAPLTRWVLGSAVRQAQIWQDNGRPLAVAVNLSAQSLRDGDLPITIAALLADAGLAPEHLTVEVTESALMLDPVLARRVLEDLAALGVRIAIDDFGTGYSSLGYLKDLPVHEIKIDRTFILGMGMDAESAKNTAIVRSVITLAHALGIQVVAEGVETQANWDALAALGCDIIQGYHLGRPMAAADLASWAASRMAQATVAAA